MKELPRSEEAESMVIGCIAEFPATWPDLANELDEQDFVGALPRRAYGMAVELDRRGDAVDGLTLKNMALASNQPEVALYIEDCALNVTGPSNIIAYAKVLRVKRIERQLLVASKQLVQLAYDIEPLKDRLASAQSLLLDLGVDKPPEAAPIKIVAARVLGSMEDRRTRPVIGLSTGFKDLDVRWGGFRQSSLIIVAGRPAMGKTTFALNMAENVAANGGRVMVFSLEMDAEELTEKTMSSRAGVFYSDISTGKFLDNTEQSARLSNAMHGINSMDLMIDERGTITLQQIRAAARKQALKKPLDLIVIDYLQLVSGEPKQSIYERITELTRGFKQLAKELKCPVVLLSQLNRNCDMRPYGQNRPTMADLRDSGSIEQDADIIAFVYRDVIYNEETMQPNIAEVVTAKCRKGVAGTDYLRAELDRSRFVTHTGQKPIYAQAKQQRGYDA